eukprot:Hpha_TRINITY_DN17542_c0_g1::TRINITY_DN17542_c0_g1_i1::g.92480::m.92480
MTTPRGGTGGTNRAPKRPRTKVAESFHQLPRVMSERENLLERGFDKAEDELAEIQEGLQAVDEAVRKSGVLSPLQRTRNVVSALARMKTLEALSPMAGGSPMNSPLMMSVTSVPSEVESPAHGKVKDLERQLQVATANLKQLSEFFSTKEELWKRLLKKKDEQLMIVMAREKEVGRAHQGRIHELKTHVEHSGRCVDALNHKVKHYSKVVDLYADELGHRIVGPHVEMPPEAELPESLNFTKMPSKAAPGWRPQGMGAHEATMMETHRLTVELLTQSTADPVSRASICSGGSSGPGPPPKNFKDALSYTFQMLDQLAASKADKDVVLNMKSTLFEEREPKGENTEGEQEKKETKPDALHEGDGVSAISEVKDDEGKVLMAAGAVGNVVKMSPDGSMAQIDVEGSLCSVPTPALMRMELAEGGRSPGCPTILTVQSVSGESPPILPREPPNVADASTQTHLFLPNSQNNRRVSDAGSGGTGLSGDTGRASDEG